MIVLKYCNLTCDSIVWYRIVIVFLITSILLGWCHTSYANLHYSMVSSPQYSTHITSGARIVVFLINPRWIILLTILWSHGPPSPPCPPSPPSWWCTPSCWSPPGGSTCHHDPPALSLLVKALTLIPGIFVFICDFYYSVATSDIASCSFLSRLVQAFPSNIQEGNMHLDF